MVYQNQPVGVRTNGVQLELWQRGYQLFSKIPVFINQDGSFSASLFDGDYKLVRLRGNGPWADNTDTINVQVRGTTQIDVPVQPYFTISAPTFQRSGTNLTSSAQINQVVSGRTVEQVTLYVGTTQFVDATNNAGSASLSGTAVADLSKPLSLTLATPAAVKGTAYVRLGVKTAGVAELLYTPVQQVTL
ncbi:DUF3823 domain-containing protein [Spirosoma rhododendri]|uniref:DUF3823 domain-containing protein n=1 Tax=Spirosoma rhododendri TaxID=2728024 RepID=UPI0020C560AF|nr:DUF3823 domain-containing protein [Spirosoma rhododendri]